MILSVRMGEALRMVIDEEVVLMYNIGAKVDGYITSEDVIAEMESILKRFKNTIRR